MRVIVKENIDHEYKLLTDKLSELDQFKKDAEQFHQEYKTKSFLKKQFNLRLNEKRTYYSFHGIEISDDINKSKKNLVKQIKEYFFYGNENTDIRTVAEENISMLEQCFIHAEVIKPFESKSIFYKAWGSFYQYAEFHGEMDEYCNIEVKFKEGKTNQISTFIAEGYIDYEGTIYPNGVTELSARNPIVPVDMKHAFIKINGNMQSITLHPTKFYVKQVNQKIVIYGDPKTDVEYPYKLLGFRLNIQSIFKEKFYQNCQFLTKEYKKFQLLYPLVYQQ